jgi:hypothetical protein
MENEMGSKASLATNRETLPVTDAVFDLLRDNHGYGAMKSFSQLLGRNFRGHGQSEQVFC